MTIQYGFGKTIFGATFLAQTNGKLLALSFVTADAEKKEVQKLKKKWPQAELEKKSPAWIQKNLRNLMPKSFPFQKISIEMAQQGTEFQNKVWKFLQKIPAGQTTTYGEIAEKIGHPKAVRAVGSAVGANPIGYLIPCHRVLPKSGGIGQFGWGPDLKKRMLLFEKCHII